MQLCREGQGFSLNVPCTPHRTECYQRLVGARDMSVVHSLLVSGGSDANGKFFILKEIRVRLHLYFGGMFICSSSKSTFSLMLCQQKFAFFSQKNLSHPNMKELLERAVSETLPHVYECHCPFFYSSAKMGRGRCKWRPLVPFLLWFSLHAAYAALYTMS